MHKTYRQRIYENSNIYTQHIRNLNNHYIMFNANHCYLHVNSILFIKIEDFIVTRYINQIVYYFKKSDIV